VYPLPLALPSALGAGIGVGSAVTVVDAELDERARPPRFDGRRGRGAPVPSASSSLSSYTADMRFFSGGRDVREWEEPARDEPERDEPVRERPV
jgi:hypothetical protein